MKKLLFLAVAFIAFSTQSIQAQACLQGVPDPAVWGSITDFTIGFTIDSDPTDVDTAQVVQGQDTTVYYQYLLPKKQAITSPITGTATVTSITLLGVSGLPIGLAWTTDAAAFANNNSYNPQSNRFGCVSICGETFAAPGIYTIVVNIQGCGSLSGISACDAQTTNLYLEVLPGTGSGPIQMSPPIACDSATVEFNTSLASPDPVLFPVAYSWLFHDGTTATGKPVSKSYTAPGDYPVRMTTTIFEYFISQATISATGGWTGDIEEVTTLQNPELYLQIDGGNGVVTTNTASSGTNRTFNNLNIPITDFTISVTGWDEDNGPPFGSQDDNLGTATTSFTSLSPGLILGYNTSNFSGTITIQQQVNTVLENWDTVRIRANSVADVILASNGFELCTGESTILDAGAGFDYYQWYDDNGSILNENAQTLSVSTAGNYRVEILEAGSICPGFSDTAVVSIASIMASNIETMDGFIYVDNPNNYDVQWYVDSAMIAGETNDTLSSSALASGGALTVNFMNASGCEATSPEFSICIAGTSSASNDFVSFSGDVANFTAEDFILTNGNAVAWAFSTEADGPITDMTGLQAAIAAGLVIPGDNDTLLSLACSDLNLSNGNYYATPFTAQSVNIDTTVGWNPFDVACTPEINLCIGLSGTDWEINPLLMVLPTGDTIDVIEVLAAGVVPAGTPINSGLWALATSQLGDPACLELVSMLGFSDNPNGTWQMLLPNTGTGALNISLSGMNVTVDADSCSQIANDLVYNIPNINQTINAGTTESLSFTVDLPQPPPAGFPNITTNCGVIGDAVMFTVYCTDTVTGPIGTPIREIASLAGVNIYPNPTTGLFKVDFDAQEAGTYQVSMFDMLGRMVNTQSIELPVGQTTLPMNASDLNKGLYHLVIRSKGQQQAFKVVLK